MQYWRQIIGDVGLFQTFSKQNWVKTDISATLPKYKQWPKFESSNIWWNFDNCVIGKLETVLSKDKSFVLSLTKCCVSLVTKGENLVLSDESMKAKLLQWKIWKAAVSTVSLLSEPVGSLLLALGHLFWQMANVSFPNLSNSTFINLFHKTKFSSFTLQRLHSFFRN